MDKKSVLTSFGHVFQDFLYRSKLPLSVANLNKFIKSDGWDGVLKVTKIYNGGVDTEITFKFKAMGSNNPWKTYQADWILKL